MLIIAILTFFAAIGILYPPLFFITIPVVIIFELVIIRAIDKKNKKPKFANT